MPSQDIINGMQCAGVVTSTNDLATQGSVVVQWHLDPTNPSGGGGKKATYRYNATDKDLFLVNPANPRSVPASIPCIPPPAPAEGFIVGDLVRLEAFCTTSSLKQQPAGIFPHLCLTTQQQLGVVIKVTKKLFVEPRGAHSRLFATGEKNPIVAVMDTVTGQTCFYPSSDLRYADGSTPGDDTHLPNAHVVRLQRNAPAACPPHPLLVPGDRVTLASTFAENHQHGWCLGQLSEKKTGVVLLAPPPKSKTAAEQRNVLVAAVDDPTRVYNYRSNWLERVPNLGLHHFGVGDKVQLDYGTAGELSD